MLPIRQTLNALPGLKRTEKAVLIEVCQLAENSEPAGWCTAKNDHLVRVLGGTERTMTRTLTGLEGRGLLRSQGKGKARRLAPTAPLRACYAGPDMAAREAAALALNLDKMGRQPRQNGSDNLDISSPNLDKNDPEPRQNDEVEADQPRQNGSDNLDKMGRQPRQNGSRVYGEQHQQQENSLSLDAAAAAERALLEKKIADLEAENLQLKAKLLALVPPVAEPPRQVERVFDENGYDQFGRDIHGMLADGHPNLYGGNGPWKSKPKPAPVEPGPAFEEFWQAFGKKVDRHKSEQRWKSLKPADQAAALAAVPAYVLATPDKKFRKDPLTWLNGRCWLDEDQPVALSIVLPYGQQPTATRAATSPTKARNQSWQ